MPCCKCSEQLSTWTASSRRSCRLVQSKSALMKTKLQELANQHWLASYDTIKYHVGVLLIKQAHGPQRKTLFAVQHFLYPAPLAATHCNCPHTRSNYDSAGFLLAPSRKAIAAVFCCSTRLNLAFVCGLRRPPGAGTPTSIPVS